MLVISRKIGETIVIGEDIEVCILDAHEGIVKIGIDAPKKIRILRKELFKEVETENVESIRNIEDVLKKLK